MNSIAQLRQKTDLIKGEEETVTADFWKKKFLDAQNAIQSLDEENDSLKKSMLNFAYESDNHLSQSLNQNMLHAQLYPNSSQQFNVSSFQGTLNQPSELNMMGSAAKRRHS